MCACVCVCVCERNRQTDRQTETETESATHLCPEMHAIAHILNIADFADVANIANEYRRNYKCLSYKTEEIQSGRNSIAKYPTTQKQLTKKWLRGNAVAEGRKFYFKWLRRYAVEDPPYF